MTENILAPIDDVRKCHVDTSGIYERSELSDDQRPNESAQIERCRAWLQAFAVPQNVINADCSSRLLKHCVERWYRDSNAHAYISNGAMCAAAIAEGYVPALSQDNFGAAWFRMNVDKWAVYLATKRDEQERVQAAYEPKPFDPRISAEEAWRIADQTPPAPVFDERYAREAAEREEYLQDHPEARASCGPSPVARTQQTPVILQKRNTFWLRKLDSLDFAKERDITEIGGELLKSYVGSIHVSDDAGRLLPINRIMADVGCVLDHMARRFTASNNTWDARTNTLTLGYNLPSVPAVFDPDVEDYLSATYAGDLHQFKECIAACDRRYLDRGAAAVVIEGPDTIAKTFTVEALASMWGTTPTPLGVALKQFNGALANSPIWHADEELPRGMSGSEFCKLIQDSSRLVELKFKEAGWLHGYSRVFVTVNAADRVRLDGAKGAAVVGAIGIRFAWFTIPPERTPAIRAALARCMRADGNGFDRERFMGHFKWIQENVVPKSQRFLGAFDREHGEARVLRNEADSYSDVFERVQAYLESGGMADFDATYPLNGPPPIIVKDGAVHVYAAGLAGGLKDREPMKRAQAALGAFREGDRVAVKVNGRTVRYWRLSTARLLAAMPDVKRVAFDETLSFDTFGDNGRLAFGVAAWSARSGCR